MDKEWSAGRELDLAIAVEVMGMPRMLAEGLALGPAPYSTNVAATWLVVEKIQRDFGRVEIAWDMRNSASDAGCWHCAIGVRFGAEADGDTAPEAVCRAARLAYAATTEPDASKEESC